MALRESKSFGKELDRVEFGDRFSIVEDKTRRDLEIYDRENGEIIGRWTSNGLVLNSKSLGGLSFFRNIIRSSPPSSPQVGDIYIDDGSNSDSGNVAFRRYTSTGWTPFPREFYWTRYTNVVRDGKGDVLKNVRVIIDYHSSTKARQSALLQVTDFTKGSGDTVSINPVGSGAKTWTEGADFLAKINNTETARNIANAINGTGNFVASNITDQDGNPQPYVSVNYPSELSEASSGDNNAWSFYTINSSNGLIAKLASDENGTVKHQPLYTTVDGFFSFYVNAPIEVDINMNKSGYTFNSSYTSDLMIPR